MLKIFGGVFFVLSFSFVLFSYRGEIGELPWIIEISPPEAEIVTAPSAQSSIATTTLSSQSFTPKEEKPEATQLTTPPEVSTPGPLAVSSAESVMTEESALVPETVLSFTNAEREVAGLSALSLNNNLTRMAEAKAADMMSKQYFAHVAPDGVDITILAKRNGYQYLGIGENLALGDFHSSLDVVTGWMNSPGHRANILNPTYTEIGVAAIKGTWKGGEVWYVVQEFGRPLSACPRPELLLKEKIMIYQNELDALAATLENLKADINASEEDQAAVSAKISDYNTIVDLYNSLIPTTKADIEKYDAQVQAFNACAAG
ncbi:MAG TPA: CAP domain-containing protein [Candidatus Paceibacterota bacterium]